MKNVPNENVEKKIGKRKPFWLLIPVFFVLLIFIIIIRETFKKHLIFLQI